MHADPTTRVASGQRLCDQKLTRVERVPVRGGRSTNVLYIAIKCDVGLRGERVRLLEKSQIPFRSCSRLLAGRGAILTFGCDRMRIRSTEMSHFSLGTSTKRTPHDVARKRGSRLIRETII